MKYLIDSNIIIYYLGGDNKVGAFIDTHLSQSAISIVTYYEVLNYGLSPQEEYEVKEFLGKFEIIPVYKDIVEKALQNTKNKKIKMADNFILSTAQIHELKIVTHNMKDFVGFDIELVDIVT